MPPASSSTVVERGLCFLLFAAAGVGKIAAAVMSTAPAISMLGFGAHGRHEILIWWVACTEVAAALCLWTHSWRRAALLIIFGLSIAFIIEAFSSARLPQQPCRCFGSIPFALLWWQRLILATAAFAISSRALLIEHRRRVHGRAAR